MALDLGSLFLWLGSLRYASIPLWQLSLALDPGSLFLWLLLLVVVEYVPTELASPSSLVGSFTPRDALSVVEGLVVLRFLLLFWLVSS